MIKNELKYNPKIKAEVIINLLSYFNLLKTKTIFAKPDGAFNYNYRASFIDESSNENGILPIKLNTKGIANHLPPTLLFARIGNHNNEGQQIDITQRIKEERNFIKEGFKFFSPLDNLFFHLRLENEKYEYLTQTGLSSDEVQSSFFDFLYQQKSIVQHHALKNMLFKYIPLAHGKIKDLNFLAKVYTMALNQKCNLVKQVCMSKKKSNADLKLGEISLGMNTAMGNEVDAISYQYFITIYFNDEAKYIEHLCKKNEAILKVVEQYFLSADVEVNYEFQLEEENTFTNQYLGLNTFLN